jgi:mannose-6-phosphate isomerase-like protein (cupin superfamily)
MAAKAFSIEALREGAKEAPDGWIQFLKVDDLRAGVYRLEAGAEDTQTPHEEDEIYFALAGKGELVVETQWGEKVLPVQKGSVLYVGKGLIHKFRAITERLELLVFFSRRP